MLLRPIVRPSQAVLETLRPKRGDVVIFEGTRHTVVDAGLKYLKVVAVGSNAPGLIRIDQCYKEMPPVQQEPQHLENLDERNNEEFED